MTILESDAGYLASIIEKISSNKKPRWRYTRYSWSDTNEWYWAPMNYNAETIWLMKVYGHTNTGRRYKE